MRNNLLFSRPRVRPVVAFVSTQDSVSTTLTPGAHQAGDLMIFAAFNSASATIPTLPAGISDLGSATQGAYGARWGYKFAASGAEGSGTWTNAARLSCQVYRGAVIGAVGTPVTGSGTTLAHAGLTMLDPGGGWIWASTFIANSTAVLGRSDVTNRRASGSGFARTREDDTNGPVPSWGSQNVTLGATSSGHFLIAVELARAA